MVDPNAEIKIYSGTEALDFLVQQRSLLEELMGKKDLFRFTLAAEMLNPTYVKCLHQILSYFYVGIIEHNEQIQAVLPLLGNSELPVAALNRMEFLATHPKIKLTDIQHLFERMMQIVDPLNISLRFFFYEFSNPNVKKILPQLGFQEKAPLRTIIHDLTNLPEVQLKEEVKLVPAEDSTTWYTTMLIPYNLPSSLIDKIVPFFVQAEKPVLDLLRTINHRFLALDSNEVIVGCIDYWTATEHPIWLSLAVKPEFRGRGLATSILSSVQKKLQRLNYTKVLGDIDTANPISSHLLYKFEPQKLGEIIRYDRNIPSQTT
ncbi:MAG: GNAT family N-acetyltransferase [Promethearchaeota archaeon]